MKEKEVYKFTVSGAKNLKSIFSTSLKLRQENRAIDKSLDHHWHRCLLSVVNCYA